MCKNSFRLLTIIICFVLILSVSGVYAMWTYCIPPSPEETELSTSLSSFRYSTFYITTVKVSGGAYQTARCNKSGDLNMVTDAVFLSDASSTITIDVTFYNNSTASYYYNKTETVSNNNSNVTYTVSGIEQKDEVPANTFKTISVTFTCSNEANTAMLSELHFNFVVDKDSIGGIVAQTAVDRFADILNNIAFEDSYDTLDTAMDNRSGFNKASAVTYIGNVSGSSSTDSNVIKSLFGDEFMSMDLDGDGKAEPITIMIKREDLDDDILTGDSYTYTYWGSSQTVNGVEMTIYITSQDLSGVSNGSDVVVYAATFTKVYGADQWTLLLPLTKGVANANNYSGYGTANSFNTDTWVSEDNKTIEALINEVLSSN